MVPRFASMHRPTFALIGTATAALALVALLAGCGKPVASASAAHTATQKTAHVNLTIVAQKPGSSMDAPAYMPSTNIVVPAHALVTVSITDEDLGDTPLPANSPFSTIKGVTGGMAYVDGVAYKGLDVTKVAHTFTVPALGVNVPLPGDAPNNAQSNTITFSFVTGDAGTYSWQCMDPCGGDPGGWGGPMATQGYMMGTLTVQG